MKETKPEYEYNIRKLAKLLKENGVTVKAINAHKYRSFHTLTVQDPLQIQQALALASDNQFVVENLQGTVLRMSNEKIIPKPQKGELTQQVAAQTILAEPVVKSKAKAQVKSIAELKSLINEKGLKIAALNPVKKNKFYSLSFYQAENMQAAKKIAEDAGYTIIKSQGGTFSIPSDGTLPKKRKRKSKKSASKAPAAVPAKKGNLNAKPKPKAKAKAKAMPKEKVDIAYEVALIFMLNMNEEEAVKFAMDVSKFAGLELITDAEKELLEKAKQAQHIFAK